MKIDHMNGDNDYTDEYCLPGSVYNETSWNFSKVGYFAKDLTDCIAANVSLLDEHDNVYVPLHAWDPTKELERTYEGEKKKCYDLMKSMALH
jgi:ribulose bisphosphate carboxylase small subunit